MKTTIATRISRIAIVGLAVALAAIAAVAFSPGVAGASGKANFEHLDDGAAWAYFRTEEGCIVTVVDVLASSYKTTGPARPDGPHTSMSLYITRYDQCSEEVLMEAGGWSPIDHSDLSISRNASGARLQTEIELEEGVSGSSFVVTVDLTWTANTKLVRDTQQFGAMDPEFIFRATSNVGYRFTDTVGVISDGSENFTPEGSVQGNLAVGVDQSVFIWR